MQVLMCQIGMAGINKEAGVNKTDGEFCYREVMCRCEKISILSLQFSCW